MPTGPMGEVIDDLRRVLARDGGGMTDGQLLAAFVRERDQSALAALVRRHGAMVWGVCRRILTKHHDAEDAFQATFLVLVTKAAAIERREQVANWLYGVAQQTAVRARALAAKHGRRERQVTAMPESATTEPGLWDSVQPLLDQELGRLPEKYRTLIVLCDLEGKTRKEVAQELACPEGTVAGRLARARALLAKRLTRRGVATSAGALGAVMVAQAASASVPPVVISTTIQATTLFAAGQMTAGVLSTKAIALSQGVLKAMLISKLKLTAFALITVGVLTVGGVIVGQRTLAADGQQRVAANQDDEATPSPAEEALAEQERAQRPQAKDGVTVSGKLEAVDADKNSVTISTLKRGEGKSEKTYSLAKDAKIQRDGKDVKLGDLKPGGQTTLKLSADEKTVVSLTTGTPPLSAPLKAVDVANNTITIAVGARAAKEDKTYPVAKEAKITIDGKDGTLADLKAGVPVIVVIENGATVVQIRTQGRRDRKQDE